MSLCNAKKKVAVIGANGFLGLSISRALCENGYSVCGIIRNSKSAYQEEYNNLKIKTLKVGNLEEIKRINLKGIKFDYIINLAARAHVTKKISLNSEKVIKSFTNIEKNIVNNFDVKNTKLIQLSTAKVKLKEKQIKISSNELVYINAKLKSEKIIQKNFKKYIILRPPLIYGPYVKANFLNLMRIIKLGIPLPFSNLNNKRSYLYIKNLVNFILEALEKDYFNNNSYYICDGNPASTKKISDLIAKNLSKKPLYFYVNKKLFKIIGVIFKKEEILNKLIGDFVIDNSKIKKDFGWCPKYNLNTGIKNTCFWYKTMFKMRN